MYVEANSWSEFYKSTSFTILQLMSRKKPFTGSHSPIDFASAAEMFLRDVICFRITARNKFAQSYWNMSLPAAVFRGSAKTKKLESVSDA